MPRSAAKAFLKFAHAQSESKMSDLPSAGSAVSASAAPAALSAANFYYYDDSYYGNQLCDDPKAVVYAVYAVYGEYYWQLEPNLSII